MRFSLVNVRVNRNNLGRLCVRAKIRDEQCIKYPELFVIEGERVLVRKASKLPPPRPNAAKNVPRPRIYIGYVKEPENLLTDERLEEMNERLEMIKQQMSGGIILDPLNVVEAVDTNN